MPYQSGDYTLPKNMETTVQKRSRQNEGLASPRQPPPPPPPASRHRTTTTACLPPYLDPVDLLRAERALQVEVLHHDAHVAHDVTEDRGADQHPKHTEAPLERGGDDYVPVSHGRHRCEGPVDRGYVPSGEGCLEGGRGGNFGAAGRTGDDRRDGVLFNVCWAARMGCYVGGRSSFRYHLTHPVDQRGCHCQGKSRTPPASPAFLSRLFRPSAPSPPPSPRQRFSLPTFSLFRKLCTIYGSKYNRNKGTGTIHTLAATRERTCLLDSKFRSPVDPFLLKGDQPVPHAAQDMRDIRHVREHLEETHHAGVYLYRPLRIPYHFL